MFRRRQYADSSSSSRSPRVASIPTAASEQALMQPATSALVTTSHAQNSLIRRDVAEEHHVLHKAPAENSSEWRDSFHPVDPPKIRKILSMDGGGVRGVSIIIILTYIMKVLCKRRERVCHPWQEFDIIGGTSTGGLIALMLGRMRMSLDECAQTYVTMTRDIFRALKRNPADPRRLVDLLDAKEKFDERVLEEAIISALKSKSLTERSLLQDTRPGSCCVFVCAKSESLGTTLFRSYDTERHNPYYDDCHIWEAARATSAASTFFKPIEIGRYRSRFVDGAFGHNNPIFDAASEATDIWGQNATYMAISIGTGDDPSASLSKGLRNLVDCLAKVATDTEDTHKAFHNSHGNMVDDDCYYRFNVPGLAELGLAEHDEVRAIAERTDKWLDVPDVHKQVSKCVNKMIFGGQRLGLENFDGTDSF